MKKKYPPKFDYKNPPEDLGSHPFYGLKLDEKQRIFRDAIYDKNKKIVFCNARAGSGKTLVAVATAKLMVDYGMYEKIIYVVSPTQENKQGFLPGDLADKSLPYANPLFDALKKIGVDPMLAVSKNDAMAQKGMDSYVDFITTTYIRGSNWDGAVIILEESQNFTFKELKTSLTRVTDRSKVICIGHNEQCDLEIDEHAFEKYIEHFRNKEYAQICALTKNYRGIVSEWADALCR